MPARVAHATLGGALVHPVACVTGVTAHSWLKVALVNQDVVKVAFSRVPGPPDLAKDAFTTPHVAKASFSNL